MKVVLEVVFVKLHVQCADEVEICSCTVAGLNIIVQ